MTGSVFDFSDFIAERTAAADERLVVSSSDDRTVRIWDVDKTAEACRFYLDARGTAVAWVDSGRLVAGDAAGNVFLFSLVGGAR